MLVLSRKVNQDVLIGGDIIIRVVKIKGSTIQLGIDAPREQSIVRGELVQPKPPSRREPSPSSFAG